MPPVSCWVMAISGAAALIAWICLWPKIHGTTLVPSWIWASLAIAGGYLFAMRTGSGSVSGTSLERLQFAVGVLSLTPWLATLGARRPHVIAWQFVVGSMVLVTCLPVLQAWLYRPHQPLVLETPWRLLLIVMLLVEATHAIRTRFLVPAVCLLAAQALWLRSFLGWRLPVTLANWGLDQPTHVLPTCLALGSLAVVGYAVLCRWPTRAGDAQTVLWREMRDWYGTLWATRWQERFNATAELAGWPVRLAWHGLTASTREVSAHEQAAIQQTWDALFWRFKRK